MADFAKAGYVPMTVNGTEYGETREYGNFSFTRVYESGHEVPYYQPVAAQALFQRTIQGLSTPDGSALTGTTSTNGTAQATHTNSFVPLPSTSSSVSTASAATTNAANTTVPQPQVRYAVKRW